LAVLIARSSSIERVELTRVELIGDDPEAKDEWVIRAPSLRELTIASCFPYGGRVEELPQLQKGVLVGCNDAKFLMGMAQITELEFACSLDWVNTPVAFSFTYVLHLLIIFGPYGLRIVPRKETNR
jgi:hypothetical protein